MTDSPYPSKAEWAEWNRMRKEMYQRVLKPLLVQTEPLTEFEKWVAQDPILIAIYARRFSPSSSIHPKSLGSIGQEPVWVLEIPSETEGS